MPELPEVETVVRTLRPLLVGRTFVHVALHRTDIVTPVGSDLTGSLLGRRVADVSRRAKRVVFTLDSNDRFYVHLGMTGQLTVVSRSDIAQPHTHLRITLGTGAGTAGEADCLELRFVDPRRFGGVWWLGAAPDDASLGPEPLTLRTAGLARRLAATRRPIKTALLDQSVVAGIGNIYADEALFAAGIHPQTSANLLSPSEVGRLSRSIKLTLNRAIRHGGSTLRDYRDANGRAGSFQRLHRVYNQTDEPCRRCATPIVRIVLGGRSTHFCPTCQPSATGRAP